MADLLGFELRYVGDGDLLTQVNKSLGASGPIDDARLDAAMRQVMVDGVPTLTGSTAGPIAGRRNRLDNYTYRVNQRGHGLGVLAAGEYFLDRFKAGPSGGEVGLAGTTLTLGGGSIQQVMELPDLAGQPVVFQLASTVNADLTVDVDGVSTVMAAGASHVDLTVPPTSTDNVTLTLSGTGVDLAPMQLAPGTEPTAIEWWDPGEVERRCMRYYQAYNFMERYTDTSGSAASRLNVKIRAVPMRDTPVTTDASTITSNGSSVAVIGYRDIVAVSYNMSLDGFVTLMLNATFDAEFA